MTKELADRVVAVVRGHIRLLDEDRFAELRDALAEIPTDTMVVGCPCGMAAVRKACWRCGTLWTATTSTNCGCCGGLLYGMES
jgi:hypothetical protein